MSALSSAHAVHPLPPTEAPVEERFGRLATEEQILRTVRALEENGIHTLVAPDRAAAVRSVLDLVPPGAEVFDATSQTLVALGLDKALSDPTRVRNLRPEVMRLAQQKQADAQRKVAAAPDFIVGSVHAITEKGQVVVASATGSQLGPYAYAAGTVIWVAGTQKIVPDLDAAFQRVQEYTLPRESERAMKAYGVPSFVAKLLVVQKEFRPGRIHLVLLRENLGF